MVVASWRHACFYVCTDEHAEPVSSCFNLSLTCSIHINNGAHYYLPFLFYFTPRSSFCIKKRRGGIVCVVVGSKSGIDTPYVVVRAESRNKTWMIIWLSGRKTVLKGSMEVFVAPNRIRKISALKRCRFLRLAQNGYIFSKIAIP